MIVGKEVYSLSRLPKRVRRSIISSLCTLASFLALTTYGVYGAGLQQIHTAQAGSTLNVWWPGDGKHVAGLQPFKAMVEGTPVEQYEMTWQVDGGAENPMQNNYTDYPHKEAAVDVSSWKWRGAGPYSVHMVAKQNGATISETTFTIYVDGTAIEAASAQPVVLSMGANVAAPAPAAAGTPAPAAPTPAPAPQPAVATVAPVQIWWPTPGSTLSGMQPFKASLSNLSPDQYDMYWQVDNGGMVLMTDNSTGGAHKESIVDLSGWTWSGNGPYYLTFTAKDKSGQTIGVSRVQLNVDRSQVIVAPAPVQTSAQAKAPTTQVQAPAPKASTQQIFQATTPTFTISLSQPLVTISGSNPISGVKLLVPQHSDALNQANTWESSRPSDAQAMRLLANQPTASWFGSWNNNIGGDVAALVSTAAAQGQAPVMVAYNIPGRDCSGGYSSGGAGSADQYRAWISSMAQAIGNNHAVVILEPDALADLSCLSQNDQQTRLSLLQNAVTTLKRNSNTVVYLDAGHSGWTAPSSMAANLRQAGVNNADGFSVNVSNYDPTDASKGYGEQISQLLGGAHYVIDTSRNGQGSNGQWCNPQGRAIGHTPTSNTGISHVDAFLWLKTPGESDGNCNGGPGAGQWWSDYALQLVRNSGQ